jgi:2-aminoethylphosphonate transport system permease protein
VADTLSVRAAARPNFQLWIVPPILVLSLVFFYPLALIVRQALSNGADGLTISHFGEVLRTQLFWNALLHTFEIAVASSIGCLALGFAIALILYFVPFPGARDVARFIDTFIALPTFLIALAFTFIYGSAGVLNGLLTESFGFEHPPIDFLY